MQRRAFAALAWGSIVCGGGTPFASASEPLPQLEQPYPGSPFDVETRAQLFVDQILVRQRWEIGFTTHQGEKHPANPV